MKAFIIISILTPAFIVMPFALWAQDTAATVSKKSEISNSGQLTKSASAADNQAKSVRQTKTVVFAPASSRDPFLSKEEVDAIERTRQSEIQRIEQERKRLLDAERARLAELEEKRRREEELRKNPAKEIINKISVDGIVGSEAIINGQFRKIGDHVLGARITHVSDSSVTFIYKGQTFVKKMKISGTAVL
jgi:hypothetical protein